MVRRCAEAEERWQDQCVETRARLDERERKCNVRCACQDGFGVTDSEWGCVDTSAYNLIIATRSVTIAKSVQNVKQMDTFRRMCAPSRLQCSRGREEGRQRA